MLELYGLFLSVNSLIFDAARIVNESQHEKNHETPYTINSITLLSHLRMAKVTSFFLFHDVTKDVIQVLIAVYAIDTVCKT